MTTTAVSVSMTAPFFLLDLADLIPEITGGVFILGTSVLGGPDVLGDEPSSESGGLEPDTLVEILGFNELPGIPPALVANVVLAISPSSNLIQAISGIAYCNAYPPRASVIQFVLLTAGGNTIIVTATYNGRQSVNVAYGAA